MAKLLHSFRDDHATALKKLTVLRGDLDNLAGGSPVDDLRDSLQDFVDFLEHALKVHFRQEEEALFPVLGRVIGTQGGPIAVMLAEHVEIKEAHDVMKEELASGKPDVDRLVVAGQRIINVLWPHIEKEDNILFPMAEQYLDTGQLEEVDRLAETLA